MAKQKIEQMLAKFQSNAWPAMLEVFAREVGVSADSLRRLEVGWAPIVDFKKGRNFNGWWAIPERNSDAEPAGISLRSRDGFKCMYPGSDHGLTYEPNPAHDRKSPQYQHGAHNWERLYDAGVECPVCGKPDGCLVSSDDPDNPQAAICIRQKEGADKPMKFGWLHILKNSGHVKGAAPLPPSDDPVVVVEGMTDTAAAMDLGFVAVGKPSNRAGLSDLKDLVRNRNVVVVGENDEIDKTTGKRPGHEGMIETFQMLKDVTTDIKQVLPPEHIKDLRRWKNKAGLTHDEFLDYVKENGRDESEQTVLPDDQPLTLAYAFLDQKHRLNGRYILRYHEGQWLRWDGRKYEEIKPDAQIKGPMHLWAYGKKVLHETPKGEETIKKLNCNRGTTGNMMEAMLGPCNVPDTDLPCWINGAEGPDPRDLIVFTNGILQISKYMRATKKTPQSEYLLPLTPDLFTLFALPFPFDETATCKKWKRALREWIGDDPDKPRLLRQWMGYCLTPDTSQHKMMLLRGPKRSGKSTALEVLQTIVGHSQCASTSFSSLTSNFGLSSLVGKQVALMGDAMLPTKTDNMQALELLLNIVGEDPVNIDRKYLPALENHKLDCRFTLSANELPSLPDHAGALESRLLILDFNNSFYKQEDRGLRKTLIEEAPGIIIWALGGLRQLWDQGYFTTPDSMEASLREFRTTTSPMAAFLEECCEEDEASEIGKEELYDAWASWSQERGMRPLSKSRFLERLKSNATYAHTTSYTKGGHKFNVVRGVKLQSWAERRLLGKPN